MRERRRFRFWALALLAGVTALAAIDRDGAGAQDWRTASRASVGLAPDPATHREAIVQVYGARTWGWRGRFGVHTWIAVKPAEAEAYTVYEVIGWRLRWSDSALSVSQRVPDARWYGNAPELLAARRGDAAAGLIARIEKAAHAYPHAHEYAAWPGPNSNTFTAWVARAVPELEVDFPPTAIGKDYLADGILGSAPSGSGVQLSLGGLFAITASPVEGLELNLLGLTFGVNPFDPALKLPLVGRLGPAR
ncbi:MAG: hypothetical protein A3I63_00335 [Betaproteobacteria bacterium RIFCSPLOWO2_02_FULL_66_14]|nr:MAG: hypothetical protein A3I63_00335 [Betaproteobacteria bacterium RIFCSPLOWO2_02_FULL_66_14]